VANVWPPSITLSEPTSTADALQAELDQRLRAAGLVCGQSLLPINADSAAECLVRNGYGLVAQLVFLACQATAFPNECPKSELTFECYRRDQQPRLIQLLEETYVDTQDAPALNGVRSAADVLAGYEHMGASSCHDWFFVRHQDCDAGCLLLADYPGLNRYELVYMGLRPQARGRRWGDDIARYAQWVARRAGRDALMLGVDAANRPALATYARCGFHEVDRRLAWFKQFAP
jgi:ribosomal protein S18 acetylase RimI-like enzyme